MNICCRLKGLLCVPESEIARLRGRAVENPSAIHNVTFVSRVYALMRASDLIVVLLCRVLPLLRSNMGSSAEMLNFRRKAPACLFRAEVLLRRLGVKEAFYWNTLGITSTRMTVTLWIN